MRGRRARSFVIGAASFALLGACDDVTRLRRARTIASPPPAVATKDATFAVGICRPSGAKGCEVFCSGTLVAPNLVLTARHCAFAVPTKTVDCRTAVFADQSMIEPADFWITTAGVVGAASRRHPAARFLVPRDAADAPVRSVCGADLMLVVLGDSIGAEEAAPIAPSFALPSSPLAAIGYGETRPGAGDYGVRRMRRGCAVLCSSDGVAKSECDDTGAKWTEHEFLSDAACCEGDSGGGAYIGAITAGETTVAGVLSRGELGLGSCSHAIYERLDVWAGFLSRGGEVAAEAGHYPVPAWANASAEPGRAPSK